MRKLSNRLAVNVASAVAQLSKPSAFSARMSAECRKTITSPGTHQRAFAWMSRQKQTPTLMVATPEDWALYLAVTMFSAHQRANEQPANVRGKAFGTALKELAAVRGIAPVERRAYAALSVSNPKRLAVHLRGLIAMMREANIGLDYVRLAYDLQTLIDPTKRSSDVSRQWGRDLNCPEYCTKDPGISSTGLNYTSRKKAS